MRIFTCTPVAFSGGPDFFERDSGLLCRGLQSIGVESRAIMPGARSSHDQADLIRTEYTNLESEEWWKSHGLDGVVLYAWGRPKFRKVAKAIHDAGIFLILNQDNGGLVSPLAGPNDWLKEQIHLSGRNTGLPGLMRWLKLVLRGATLGLAVTDPLRAQHLRQGDVIACVSPKAMEYHRKWSRFHGGVQLADRLTVLPHCVEPSFCGMGGQKHRQVVCVGRWDDVTQKRPHLLADVASQMIERDYSICFAIAGTPDSSLTAWHAALKPQVRERVKLMGKVGRVELRKLMNESQVFYSPSAYESFGIAAAEALCCGCSVVAARSVSMVSFEWFVSQNSGRLAEVDTPASHLQALTDELRAWDLAERDARQICQTWTARLHADKVAQQVVSLVETRKLSM